MNVSKASDLVDTKTPFKVIRNSKIAEKGKNGLFYFKTLKSSKKYRQSLFGGYCLNLEIYL